MLFYHDFFLLLLFFLFLFNFLFFNILYNLFIILYFKHIISFDKCSFVFFYILLIITALICVLNGCREMAAAKYIGNRGSYFEAAILNQIAAAILRQLF